MALPDSPLTRGEQYLSAIAGQEAALPNVPLTRTEQYLAKIAGQDVAIPNVPLTRQEQYLAYIAENGGGGGGDDVDPYAIARSIIDRSITEYVDTELKVIGNNAFSFCDKLTKLQTHNVEEIKGYGCQKIAATPGVAFPNLLRLSNSEQYQFTQSTTPAIDLGNKFSASIKGYFMANAGASTLILRYNGVVPLGHIGSLPTKFQSNGTGGTLYVPQAQISNYQSATNWSTVLGYANNQILPIEGSIYKTQYADGTPIE